LFCTRSKSFRAKQDKARNAFWVKLTLLVVEVKTQSSKRRIATAIKRKARNKSLLFVFLKLSL
jgi:hypothetical protein